MFGRRDVLRTNAGREEVRIARRVVFFHSGFPKIGVAEDWLPKMSSKFALRCVRERCRSRNRKAVACAWQGLNQAVESQNV